MKSWLVQLAAFGCLTFSPLALSEPSETDKSLAQSLFEQGKQLMDTGKFSQACPKLQESQRLDPGGGTLLNLALCHEQEGKIASAWTEFKEALSMARRDARQERIDAAEEHIAALEPKLPRLTLTVPNASPGEDLQLDANAIGSAAWGGPLSIDPGEHEVTATAPGKKRWSTKLTIAVAEKRSLAVPDLEAETVAPAPPPAAAKPAELVASTPPAAHQSARSGSAAGWIVGAAGIVGIGVGSYFGLQAFSKRSDSNKLCPTDATCQGDGAKYNDQAYTAAWISDVGFGVGIVGLGVGTYLLLSGGSSEEKPPQASGSRTRVTADVAALPGGGFMNVSGVW
jgi:hypothetical protein